MPFLNILYGWERYNDNERSVGNFPKKTAVGLFKPLKSRLFARIVVLGSESQGALGHFLHSDGSGRL
jgi:hypothetical protein